MYTLHFELAIIVVIALLEEIIFRGFALHIAFMTIHPFFIFLTIFFSTFLFGLSHIQIGNDQFFAKSFLGLLCVLVTLIFHSLLPAIIIHATLNIFAYFSQPRMSSEEALREVRSK
jgi:membrane protease YdiL (CAAX protease family)